MGRLLPVMIKKRAGRIRPKGLVRSDANGRASLCNTQPETRLPRGVLPCPSMPDLWSHMDSGWAEPD